MLNFFVHKPCGDCRDKPRQMEERRADQRMLRQRKVRGRASRRQPEQGHGRKAFSPLSSMRRDATLSIDRRRRDKVDPYGLQPISQRGSPLHTKPCHKHDGQHINAATWMAPLFLMDVIFDGSSVAFSAFHGLPDATPARTGAGTARPGTPAISGDGSRVDCGGGPVPAARSLPCQQKKVIVPGPRQLRSPLPKAFIIPLILRRFV